MNSSQRKRVNPQVSPSNMEISQQLRKMYLVEELESKRTASILKEEHYQIVGF